MDRHDPKRSGHVADRLAPYLDRELPAEAATEVEAHLADCTACSDLRASMTKTGETLEQALLLARQDHVPVERLEAHRLKETEDKEARLIAAHLRLCSHCREALAHLSYLAEAESSATTGGRVVAWAMRSWGLRLRAAGVAAAATVVIAFAAWYVLLPASPDRQERLAVLAQVEPPPYVESQPRAGTLDPEASERLRNGMRAYAAGQYQEAMGHLAPFVEQHPDSQQATFFLAACHLLTDEPAPAISLLHRLLRDPGPYAERAHFYLGKAYLKSGDLEGARREVDQVAVMGGRYQDEARAILAELRRLK